MEPNPTLHAPQEAGRQALSDALRLSFRLLSFTMVLLGVAYLLSGIFVVHEHERAYVLVFGRISGVGSERLKEPGLHWTLPKPFAEIVRIPAERIQTVESDSLWYYRSPSALLSEDEGPSRFGLEPGRDGYLLSGDANILHTQWGIRYNVRDPEAYLFHFENPEAILLRELDRAAIRTAQQWGVDRLLRTDIEGYRAAVDLELRRRLTILGLGLQVLRLDLLDVIPPRQVEASFEAVIESEQERSRSISAARAYVARLENETEGQRSQLLAQARAAQERTISEARADAQFFSAMLEEYRAAPVMLANTLWQDRLRRVLSRVDEQFFLVERADGTRELRLLVGPSGARP